MKMIPFPFMPFLPALALFDFGQPAAAIEEPPYTVIEERDGYEIRRYDSYVVAETTVSGDFETAGNRAFRVLANYIFGNNSRAEEMSMTVPVESRLADDQRHLAAAPAEMQTSAGSEWTYTFVMEKQYALTELPSPRDERVVLRQVPPRTVAAIRFSGTWSSRNYEKHEAMLLGALAADEIAVSGPPSLARYNGPVTPWFLRRNEVIVPVNWPMSARRNAPTG